jgi:large subunit ribosomal protein L29
MKMKDLNSMSEENLITELNKVYKEIFKYRMQKAHGQLNQNHLLRNAKRTVARIKTLLNQIKTKS